MGGVLTAFKYKGYISDTAILVHSESSHSEAIHDVREDIALDLGSPLTPASLAGFRFAGFKAPHLESPSECTTLSLISNVTAAPLDQKHRYHFFFAYHQNDTAWVKSTVTSLESEPYNFKCCYWERDFNNSNGNDNLPCIQNILCSVMLSHRIVIVLTPDFVQEAWHEYEESLTHLTSLSIIRRQRVISVMLEDCEPPASIQSVRSVDAKQVEFIESLLNATFVDGVPFSETNSLGRSPSTHGYSNGQVLVTLSATIEGFCSSHLLYDCEEVPDALAGPEICLSLQEYADIVKAVGQHKFTPYQSWIFSALPTLLLIVIFIFWCIAFILVIVLFPDNHSSTLPVRLCVFTLPAIFIVLGCILRWRKVKQYKERHAMRMFSRAVHVNRNLYMKKKPVIITAIRTMDDAFHICFLYFDMTECIDRIMIYLTNCSEQDLFKLGKLVDVYTVHSGYLEGRPLASKLATMMGSAYAIQRIFKRLPNTLERRHSKNGQCLCQFIEEFLATYLPCVRHEADLNSLSYLFLKYLNCQVRSDFAALTELGITVIQA